MALSCSPSAGNIVHAIDAASAQACPTTLALVAATVDSQASAGSRPMVLLLGGSSLERAAAAAGLADSAARTGLERGCKTVLKSASVPLGRAELGPVAAHRALPPSSDLEVIYTWSAGAWRMLRWLRARAPRVLCVVQPPDQALSRAVAKVCRDGLGRACASGTRREAVLALDSVLGRMLPGAGRGVEDYADDRGADGGNSEREKQSPVFWPTEPASLVNGEADAERADVSSTRTALRRRWGCDRVKAGEFVVALLSDPPEAADTREALLTIGVMREAMVARRRNPPNVALVVHPRQHQLALAMRTASMVRTPIRLIQDANLAAPWHVLPGCDAALTMDSGGGGLSVAAAMIMGKPIVAPDTPRQRLRLVPEHSGLLAASSKPRHLAAQLQRLAESPELASRLGKAARCQVRSFESWMIAVNAVAAWARGDREQAVPLANLASIT